MLVGSKPMTGLSITRLIEYTIPNEAIMISASGNRVIAPLIKGSSNDINTQLRARGSQYRNIVFVESVGRVFVVVVIGYTQKINIP